MSSVTLNSTLPDVPRNEYNTPRETTIRQAFPKATREFPGKEEFDDPIIKKVENSELFLISTEEKYKILDTNNGFLDAIVFAYNNHLSLEIFPEDILYCFSTGVIRCLNDNPEKYRDLFVSHQGKTKLDVKTGEVLDFEAIQWEPLVAQMVEKINQEVKTPLSLEYDFSTSTNFHKTVGNLMKMIAFKKYFSYGFEFGCGLRGVSLLGTDEDWERLYQKIEKTSEIFTSRGNLANWSRHFLTVVHKMRETRKNVDDDLVTFWSRIVTYIPYGSGGQQYISGWCQVLFPGEKYDKFPEKWDILDSKIEEPKSNGWSYDTTNLMKWVGEIFSSECLETMCSVEAKANHFGKEYDLFFSVGYLGFTEKEGMIKPLLGYFGHRALVDTSQDDTEKPQAPFRTYSYSS